MEKLQASWKLSRQCGNFPDYLEIFQTFWKLSRQFGNLPENLEGFYAFYTFQTLWKICRKKPETFQTIQKHSKQSGNFPDNPETFRKLQWFPGQVPNIIDKSMFSATTFRTHKNFPGTMLPRSLHISVSAPLWGGGGAAKYFWGDISDGLFSLQ